MRLRIFLKYALYAIAILLVFCLQSALAPFVCVFGVRPDLMPVLAACAAVFEPVFPAAFLGLWIGILCDIRSVSGLYFTFFYYFASAAVSHVCTRRFYPRAPVALGAVAAMRLFSQGICYLFYYLPFYRADGLRFLRILAVGSGLDLLAFYPIFALCRTLHALTPAHPAANAARPDMEYARLYITRVDLSGARKRRPHGNAQ